MANLFVDSILKHRHVLSGSYHPWNWDSLLHFWRLSTHRRACLSRTLIRNQWPLQRIMVCWSHHCCWLYARHFRSQRPMGLAYSLHRPDGAIAHATHLHLVHPRESSMAYLERQASRSSRHSHQVRHRVCQHSSVTDYLPSDITAKASRPTLSKPSSPRSKNAFASKWKTQSANGSSSSKLLATASVSSLPLASVSSASGLVTVLSLTTSPRC